MISYSYFSIVNIFLYKNKLGIIPCMGKNEYVITILSSRRIKSRQHISNDTKIKSA